MQSFAPISFVENSMMGGLQGTFYKSNLFHTPAARSHGLYDFASKRVCVVSTINVSPESTTSERHIGIQNSRPTAQVLGAKPRRTPPHSSLYFMRTPLSLSFYPPAPNTSEVVQSLIANLPLVVAHWNSKHGLERTVQHACSQLRPTR